MHLNRGRASSFCSFNRSNVHEYDDMAIFVDRHLTPSSNQPALWGRLRFIWAILPKFIGSSETSCGSFSKKATPF